MEYSGLKYLCKTLNTLTGIPVRILENDSLKETFSLFDFIIDPLNLYLYKLKEDNLSNIVYFSTPSFFYYCYLKHLSYKIVIGPFRLNKASSQILNDLAFELGVDEVDKPRFKNDIASITSIPLESVITSLCAYNYVLNGEKLNLEDILISSSFQQGYEQQKANDEIDYKTISQIRSYTLEIENKIAGFIERGDMEGFKNWTKSAPSIRPGQLSSDYLRHQKNIFITSATLFSRAAIKGGLDYNDALDLSDSYIQQCESLNDYDEITNLTYSMIKTFIEKVNRVKATSSILESKISAYLYRHISEKISLDDLADTCFMSKSNLCKRFKDETGITVMEFITKKRLEESLSLLRKTDKPLIDIAYYLGFSSLPHFSFAFKKEYGIAPNKYRNQI